VSQSTIPPTIMLDACVLINLLASGEADDILRSSGKLCRICVAVKNETLYLRSDDPQEETFEPAQFNSLIQSDVLSVCDIEGDSEALLYVDRASKLDDGEAMSLAIAEARGYILATDDRKARRIFLEPAGDSSRLTSSSELIRNWSESQSISSSKLKTVLMSIRYKANFFPPRRDANFKWWNDSCV